MNSLQSLALKKTDHWWLYGAMLFMCESTFCLYHAHTKTQNAQARQRATVASKHGWEENAQFYDI